MNEEKTSDEQLLSEILNGLQVICDRHGTITNSSLYLRSSQIDTDENKKEGTREFHSFFCLSCLHEYLNKLVQDGILGKTHLALSQEVIDKLKLDEDELKRLYEKFQSGQLNYGKEKEGIS